MEREDNRHTWKLHNVSFVFTLNMANVFDPSSERNQITSIPIITIYFVQLFLNTNNIKLIILTLFLAVSSSSLAF